MAAGPSLEIKTDPVCFKFLKTLQDNRTHSETGPRVCFLIHGSFLLQSGHEVLFANVRCEQGDRVLATK